MESRDIAVAEILRGVGYPLVQVQARVPGLGRAGSVDVLAFEANLDGELQPAVAVEIQASSPHNVRLAALAQLAAIRDVLNTHAHYVVEDGCWLRADSGLRILEPVAGPDEPTNLETGRVTSPELAAELLSRHFWEVAARARDRVERPNTARHFVETLRDAHGGTLVTRDGDRVSFTKAALWSAARQTIDRAAGRDRDMAEHFGDARVARIVASLLGDKLRGSVFDPFCGTGGFLWAAMDRADTVGRTISVRGNDLFSPDVATLLASLAPFETAIEMVDSFRGPLETVDAVVSEPPLGLRFQDPYGLLSGVQTRDGDIAGIDRCVRLLRPGGRAVLHLPTAFTFRNSAAPYRQFLATEFRVAAIIGLPPGTFPGTSIPAVLVVIDAATSTETFVAQLGEDWDALLSPEGPAMRACLDHLDAFAEGART